MNKLSNRRMFLRTSATACAGFCLLAGSNLKAMSALLLSDDEIDPKALNYCGHTCTDECNFRKATLQNDVELKKQAYADWHIKEQYNIDFDAENTFCNGCKTTDKPVGVAPANCTVRACAIEKGFDSCVQCNNLKNCDKNLWNRFPDFKKMVIEMQQKYQTNVKG